MSGDTPAVAPPGHSIVAHQVHGWCSKCPGREIWEELHAWRLRERRLRGDLDPVPATPEDGSG